MTRLRLSLSVVTLCVLVRCAGNAEVADGGMQTLPGTDPGGEGGAGPSGISGSGTGVPTVPFSPARPATYVAKVKALVVGDAPTADEVAAVEANPAQLRTLVDTWLQEPAYQDVLLELFGRFFQQDGVSQSDLGVADQQASGGGGVSDDLTIRAVRESFGRTARALVNANRPFTETMTTRSLMMNVPLMVYYGLIEALQVGDDGKRTDLTIVDNPNVQFTYVYSVDPTDLNRITDASNPATYMTFHSRLGWLANPSSMPDCLTDGKFVVNYGNSRTGITFAENLFHAVSAFDIVSIFVRQYCAGPAGNESWTPDDLTWRMVTVRPPRSGEDYTRFYDVPTLRAAKELLLRSPRVGFYTTPAFMGQWASNMSNQSRAMVNQAMIVGIGQAFDGSQKRQASDLRALDQNRFVPGGSCFGCHVSMDPARQFYRQHFSTSGDMQVDPKVQAIAGVFPGATANVQDDDTGTLGAQLAAHPNFALAWAQRVCAWASSSSCDATDPELQRLASVFVASNYNFNQLMAATLTSPLVTFASATASAQAHGAPVSIARRNQLCRVLSSRLDYADVCGLLPDTVLPAALQPISTIASAMAGDDFARGQVSAVAVTQPSMTYRSGVENICTLLASYFVGAGASGGLSTADPNAAIQTMVVQLMGVSGAQQAVVSQALSGHFLAAKQAGADATAALQSTFVTACLSPQVVAVGY